MPCTSRSTMVGRQGHVLRLYQVRQREQRPTASDITRRHARCKVHSFERHYETNVPQAQLSAHGADAREQTTKGRRSEGKLGNVRFVGYCGNGPQQSRYPLVLSCRRSIRSTANGNSQQQQAESLVVEHVQEWKVAKAWCQSSSNIDCKGNSLIDRLCGDQIRPEGASLRTHHAYPCRQRVRSRKIPFTPSHHLDSRHGMSITN
ncbi:hypothetical protein MRB53_038059 [Persea americana]|nr:hypothetical protein MRB53_038059 [Persea americana]